MSTTSTGPGGHADSPITDNSPAGTGPGAAENTTDSARRLGEELPTRRRRGWLPWLIGAAVLIVLGAAVAVFAGSRGDDQATGKYSAADKPLRIFASVTPHAEILRYVNDKLANGKYSLQVIEETDGVNGNDVVEHGDADASYFEHVPYLRSDTTAKGFTDLAVAATVHVEPYGIYSSKYKNVADVPAGSLVLLSNNVSNFARGLYLLQNAGLITLDHQFGDSSTDALTITEKNIVSNPKQLRFQQVEPAQIPRSLPDAALGLINGNVALEAGLTPSKDALLLEKAEQNPYANVLVVPSALRDDPRVKGLADALQSAEVATFIAQKYPGSVVPVRAAA
jgi:D-methionine transport system substrate-binding protein